MQYMGGEPSLGQSQGHVEATEQDMKNINANIDKVEGTPDVEQSPNEE